MSKFSSEAEPASAEDMSAESQRSFEFLDAVENTQQKQSSYLLGRILTVIDTLSLMESQRKAVKDLIHSAFTDYGRKQKYLSGEIFSQVNFLLTGIHPERLEGLDDAVYLPSLDMNRGGNEGAKFGTSK